MPDNLKSPSKTTLFIKVTEAEDGQKIGSFINRHLGTKLPRSALMRLIRKKSIRIDGKRTTFFARVKTGETVRIPAWQAPDRPPPVLAKKRYDCSKKKECRQISIIYQNESMLVMAKPCGLPVHNGSGWEDSLCVRVHQNFPDDPYKATPVHRLDKDTSGIVIMARSHSFLRTMHQQWNHTSKTYLAWVNGIWPKESGLYLKDKLVVNKVNGQEKTVASNTTGKESASFALPLKFTQNKTLLALRLLTGRKHQLRVQLSSRGYPIAGDKKYGSGKVIGKPGRLYLHAWKIAWPGSNFTCNPEWEDQYLVKKQELDEFVINFPDFPDKD